jgi:hypothetical protein
MESHHGHLRSAVPDLRHLPFDNTYARLGAPYARRGVEPRRGALLDIDPGEVESPFWVEAFSCNAPLPGADLVVSSSSEDGSPSAAVRRAVRSGAPRSPGSAAGGG